MIAAFIAIFGTILGAVVLMLADRRLSNLKAVETAEYMEILEASNALGPAKTTMYDCAVFGQRMLETKLVDAGVIKPMEMTVCEDSKCPNCEPTHKLFKPTPETTILLAGGITANEIRSERYHVYSDQHSKPVYTYPPRPDNVPEHANVQAHYDPAFMTDYIVWSWTDEGVKKFVKRNVTL